MLLNMESFKSYWAAVC